MCGHIFTSHGLSVYLPHDLIQLTRNSNLKFYTNLFWELCRMDEYYPLAIVAILK